MRIRLYLKILGWFLLNLLLLAAAVLVFLRAQFDFDLNGLMSGRAGSQVDAVSRLIDAELQASSPDQWDTVLARYDAAYNVQFSVYRPDGVPIAGVTNPLPPQIDERLSAERPPPPPDRPPLPPDRPLPPPGGGDWRRPGGPPPAAPPARFPKELIYTRNPSTWWALVEIRLPGPKNSPKPNPGILVIRSGSLNAGGLFFDVRPWLVAGAAMVLASALFWLPFVRRITRSLSGMTEATRRIADGHFDITVQSRSRDELGSLADSINRMAARLDGFVSGQKRFLGDIAHELCAPLARIQIGLGILEERAAAEHQAAIADVREEADQMNSLVNELLAFSKAALGAQASRRTVVDVGAVAERAARREAAHAELRMPEEFFAMADEHLLERAIANLVRNALRHGGGGMVEVVGRYEGEDEIVLTIADSGPGVPEDSIGRIFDPFFRLDASRSRETGGVGLGLAIVKTCIESCGGTVACRNRQPTGLEVILRLPAAT